MALRIGGGVLTLGNGGRRSTTHPQSRQRDQLSLGDPVWSAERAAIARAGKAGIWSWWPPGTPAWTTTSSSEQPQGQPPSWAPSYPASYTLKNILAAASSDRDQYGYVPSA